MILYTDIDPFTCEVLRARVADGSLPMGEVIEQDVSTLDPRGFTQIHLFCGIGGIPPGFHRAGWPAEWSLVTGGFPCQDVSVAGKGLGVEGGARSGLWKEMHRVIGTVRPEWVLAENVPALRTRGADRVLGDLEDLGYACWASVVGAEHVGAPHKRHRVWIVGHACSPRAGNALRADRGPGRKPARARQPETLRQAHGADGSGWVDSAGGDDAVDHSAGTRCAGNTDSIAPRSVRDEARRAEPAGSHRGGGTVADTIDPARATELLPERAGREAAMLGRSGEGLADGGEREQLEHPIGAGREERHAPALAARAGFGRWPMPPGPHQHPWEAPRLIESGVGGAADGVSRRLAGYLRRNGLKALGNSVCPQVVEVVARGMIEFANTKQKGTHQ